MEYLDYTQEDATNDGIEYTISCYSRKVVVNNKTIGAIIFQDKKLIIDKSIIGNIDDKNAKFYFESINKANSLYLRKIFFSKEYLDSGELENLFDYITIEIIPQDFLIWCNDTSLIRKYLTQIGGFNPPLHKIPNSNIMLFSMNL